MIQGAKCLNYTWPDHYPNRNYTIFNFGASLVLVAVKSRTPKLKATITPQPQLTVREKQIEKQLNVALHKIVVQP